MTERTVRIVVAGVGALLGALALYLVNANGPKGHDEPIIIDNGPLKVDFKSYGFLMSSKFYAREKACRVLHLDVYKAGTSIASENLGDETIGLVLDGDADAAPSVVFSRPAPEDAPDPNAPCVEASATGIVMASKTPEFEYNGNKKKIKVKSNWNGRWIKKIRYYKQNGNTLSYVPVRESADNDEVKVVLTVKQ